MSSEEELEKKAVAKSSEKRNMKVNTVKTSKSKKERKWTQIQGRK